MFRIGQGLDVHQTQKGKQVTLGGIKIPAPFSLKGHSDADVLLHAITDALLGAVSEHDIGYFFPPSQAENKDRDSCDFLEFAYKLVKDKGYVLGNLDATLICEHPKIGTHRENLQTNIARILQVEKEKISIKATTSEKLGFTGREEGIAAQCVVLLMKDK